jgi:hypothetical protein
MEIGEATKRLAFIKYLFTVGVEQTEKPEPLCWASVLTFHDAVELFLQLAAEYVNVKERLKDIHFLDYWNLINACLKSNGKTELTQIISMERLNKARVNFKHYGTPPSKSAITGDFRVSVTNFFEENTMLVFDIKFADISMLEVISYQRTKDDLKQAEELLNQNKLEDSLDNVALAFQKLTDDYESRKRDKWGDSPFSVGPRKYFSGFVMGIRGELGDFIDWARESLGSIQEIVKIIGFGIDYKKYARFKLLTPYVIPLIGGTYSIQRKDRGSFGNPSVDDVKFCIDFVVESALTLQEFDFEVRKAEKS